MRLQDTAYELREHPHIATSSIIKTRPDHVNVYVRVRRPLLKMKVNQKLRYISNQGKIFGVIKKESTLPLLTGVLKDDEEYHRDVEDMFILTLEENSAIHEALTLVRLANASDFPVSSMNYEKYRGLSLKIKGINTDVHVGNPPYEQKLKKLTQIIDSLHKKKSHALRIELDYEGKAFIKKNPKL